MYLPPGSAISVQSPWPTSRKIPRSPSCDTAKDEFVGLETQSTQHAVSLENASGGVLEDAPIRGDRAHVTMETMWGTFLLEVYRQQHARDVRDAMERVLGPESASSWSTGGVYVFWNPDTREPLYVGI